MNKTLFLRTSYSYQIHDQPYFKHWEMDFSPVIEINAAVLILCSHVSVLIPEQKLLVCSVFIISEFDCNFLVFFFRISVKLHFILKCCCIYRNLLSGYDDFFIYSFQAMSTLTFFKVIYIILYTDSIKYIWIEIFQCYGTPVTLTTWIAKKCYLFFFWQKLWISRVYKNPFVYLLRCHFFSLSFI